LWVIRLMGCKYSIKSRNAKNIYLTMRHVGKDDRRATNGIYPKFFH